MPYRRKKVGTRRVQKSRVNPQTRAIEYYDVEINLYEDVWESDNSSSSGFDSGSSDYGSSDSGSSSYE